jgi:hypothetical protein
MCSTPQKQPAATVALAAPSGTDTGPPGLRPRLVELLKGRMSREMKDGNADAMAGYLAMRIAREKAGCETQCGLVLRGFE